MAKSSYYRHKLIQLAKYRGQPLATGDIEHNKAELMSLETGQWRTGPEYPFHSS